MGFKGKAKAFVRAYGFLASILPYTNAEWERLAIFLNFLIPKLPAPKEEDLSKDVLEAIDMDSYRVEVRAASSTTRRCNGCSSSCWRTHGQDPLGHRRFW
jgi:type I restriction enzyme, R subunit